MNDPHEEFRVPKKPAQDMETRIKNLERQVSWLWTIIAGVIGWFIADIGWTAIEAYLS